MNAKIGTTKVMLSDPDGGVMDALIEPQAVLCASCDQPVESMAPGSTVWPQTLDGGGFLVRILNPTLSRDRARLRRLDEWVRALGDLGGDSLLAHERERLKSLTVAALIDEAKALGRSS